MSFVRLPVWTLKKVEGKGEGTSDPSYSILLGSLREIGDLPGRRFRKKLTANHVTCLPSQRSVRG